MTIPWDKYANLNWPVFPVIHKGKKPAIKWATFQTRLPTPEEIATWKTRLIEPNIGLATGAVSRVIVLDVDSEEGWQYLEQNRCHLPVTPRVQTSPGKQHIYFEHPGKPIRNWAKKLPGMDIRGDGGYVLLPPSLHPSGTTYEWVEGLSIWDVKPAPIPGWLMNTFAFTVEPSQGMMDQIFILEPDWVKEVIKGVAKGRRNETAAKLAGRYLAFQLSESEVINLLLQWNHGNKPPLKESEIYATFNSIARAEGRRRLRSGIEVIGQPREEKKKAGPDEDGPSDNDLLDPEERRAVTLESLGAKLKLPISDVIRVGGDEVKLIFRIENLETWVTIAQLTSHRTFQVKMAELTSRIIPKVKGDEWLVICQLILNVAREVDPGPDATVKGQIEEMLGRYLEAVPPDKNPSDLLPFVFRRDPKKDKEKDNFDGVAIFLTKFAEWMKLAHDIPITTKSLAQRVKALGAANRQDRINNKSKRFWVIPFKLTGLSYQEFSLLLQEDETEEETERG